MSVAPTLVFGWGNPSRGDDALGPLFVEAIEALQLPGVECLTDFQLQVEHALDLRDRQRVLFIDASLGRDFAQGQTCRLSPLHASRGAECTTHALHPQAVLHVYSEIENRPPPPAWLLEIKGVDWALGSPLSAQATHHLREAQAVFMAWLKWLPEPTAGLTP